GTVAEPLPKRKIISCIEGEVMAYVLVGACAFCPCVIFVLIILEETYNVIDRVRPRIVRIEPKALCQIASEGQLHCVVVRLWISTDRENIAETIGQRPNTTNRIGTIDVPRRDDTIRKKVRYVVADICGLECSKTDVLLDTQR